MRTPAALWLLPVLAAPAIAQKVTTCTPGGGQRGSEVTVQLRGERLAQALTALPLRPGLRVVSCTPGDKPDRCALRLEMPADCPLGAHPLRLVTSAGLSNVFVFAVGVLPEVASAQARPDHGPQPVPFGCTVDGELRTDPVDRFGFDAPAGPVLCEIESMRLGRPTDLELEVVDAAGHRLAAADDTALGRKDPWVAFTLPASAHVEVRVRAAVPGAPGGAYRLHVGALPRPTGALPCGGQPGELLDVTLLGAVPAGARAWVRLPDDGSDVFAWCPVVGGVVAPSPIWLRVGGPPNREAPPAADGSRPLEVPGAVHGVVAAPGATCTFTFAAKKGKAVELRVVARELRSPLDAVLTVRGANGRVLASNDDGTSPDSSLRFDPPADGDYRVEIADLLHGGSPEHFFRLEAGPRAAAGRLSMVVQRQEEAVLAVPRGQAGAAVLRADNLAAGLEPLARELPAGVTAEFGPRLTGSPLLALRLQATGDAPAAGALLQFAGRGEPPTPLGFAQPITLVSGRNDTPQLQTTQRALPVAVTAALPFAATPQPPTVPIVRGAPFELPIAIARGTGFAGRVRVRGLWAPPGVTLGQATADEKAAATTVTIEATASAPLGTFPCVFVASARVDGATGQQALPFVPIEIVEPVVRGEPGTARTDAGKNVDLPVALTPVGKPTGPYRATLLGLPRGVRAEPLQVAADATTATFHLEVAADAAVGRHPDLGLELRVPTARGELLHRFRGGELRIDAPLPGGSR